MKKRLSKRLFCISAATAAFAISGTAGSLYAHTGGDVTLKDASGTPVAGTTNSYSPKQTCGSCHDYESSWATSVKSQVNRLGQVHHYDVPYPQHGVSAGYHFQQGRNIDWKNGTYNSSTGAWDGEDTDGSVQAQFYGVPKFTSSSGMYGKY